MLGFERCDSGVKRDRSIDSIVFDSVVFDSIVFGLFALPSRDCSTASENEIGRRLLKSVILYILIFRILKGFSRRGGLNFVLLSQVGQYKFIGSGRWLSSECLTAVTVGWLWRNCCLAPFWKAILQLLPRFLASFHHTLFLRFHHHHHYHHHLFRASPSSSVTFASATTHKITSILAAQSRQQQQQQQRGLSISSCPHT